MKKNFLVVLLTFFLSLVSGNSFSRPVKNPDKVDSSRKVFEPKEEIFDPGGWGIEPEEEPGQEGLDGKIKAIKFAWSLEEPAEAQGSQEERLTVFRRIRDEIKKRVEDFIRQA